MKKIVTLFLALIFTLFNRNVCFSQIVFNGATTGSGSGVGTLTYAKTISSGANRLLYVGVTTQDKAISSVTWNGQALTQFTIGTRNSMRVAMYYIVLGTSATPTTANVVVTLAGNTDVFSGAADYSGVWQSPPLASPTASQAKSTFPSITFTSMAGHVAVSLMGDIAASPTANGAGQSQYWSFTGSHSNRSTQKPGAASVTMSHTLSANEDWVMLGGTMLDYSIILPIELTAFSAIEKEKKVVVDWETASEKNSDYFTIQSSLDALNFKDLGTVKGAGNSLTQIHYSFIDESPSDGLSYYRLKQTDLDQKSTYSNIVAVNVKEISIVSFFPNPATNSAQVLVNSPENKSVSFVIISNDGRKLKEVNTELKIGINNFIFDVTELAEGNYLVKVQDAYKTYAEKQLIIKK